MPLDGYSVAYVPNAGNRHALPRPDAASTGNDIWSPDQGTSRPASAAGEPTSLTRTALSLSIGRNEPIVSFDLRTPRPYQIDARNESFANRHNSGPVARIVH